MSFTKKEQSRYRAIVRQLAELSRDGWSKALPVDYVPLEIELRTLADKITLAA